MPTMTIAKGLFQAEDGALRCFWCQASPAYRHYHDHEWGFPVSDDRRLFEKLCLEGFQAGLSWLTILNKREAFRRGFAGFDAERVARFNERDVERLLGDADIVRHRGKIESTINNAKRVIELRNEFGSLAAEATHAGHLEEAGQLGRVDRDVEGPEEARLELRRSDHGLCLHAGDGPGQRPHRGLPRARARRAGAAARPMKRR